METSILAGRLGQLGHKVPRSLGFSAPVTQSADVADAVQLPRLSSAWANNTANRGAAGRQAIALAGPAGDPQIGFVETFDESQAGSRVARLACDTKQRHRAEFTVDDSSRLQLVQAFGVDSGGDVGQRTRSARFIAGAIDFEFGNRL